MSSGDVAVRKRPAKDDLDPITGAGVMPKLPRMKRPAAAKSNSIQEEKCFLAYTVGERVVYTPDHGHPRLGTIQFVGELKEFSSVMVGIKFDIAVSIEIREQHAAIAQEVCRCPVGQCLLVSSESSCLRRIVSSRERWKQATEKLQRVLQGLEVLHEKSALKNARIRGATERTLRADAESGVYFNAMNYDIRRASCSAITLSAHDRSALCRSISTASINGTQEDATNHRDAFCISESLVNSILSRKVSLEEAKTLFAFIRARFQEPLHPSLILELARAGKEVFAKESTVLQLQTPEKGHLVILGDTHGHLKDVVHIWHHQGLPSPSNVYIFNGDICDRGDSEQRGGQKAVNIWACLLIFKIACPESVFMTRGNHEDGAYWHEFFGNGNTFLNELQAAYSKSEADQLAEIFQEMCDVLPLAAVVDNRCLVVHGGLPRLWQGRGAVRLPEVARLLRPVAMPESPDTRDETIVFDLTWSDPQFSNGIGENSRGDTVISYGPDVTQEFLQAEGLSLLIRSHEVPSGMCAGRGFQWHHAMHGSPKLFRGQLGSCLTVFTASDYGGAPDTNKGARIVFKGKSKNFTIIEHSGDEAAKTLLASFDLPMNQLEQLAMTQSMADREVVALIVRHKHDLLKEFMACDINRTLHLQIEDWADCCFRVLPSIPWDHYAGDLHIAPVKDGYICYTSFLLRYQVRYRNKMGRHAGFRRALMNQLFQGLLREDYSLRETLAALDSDGDGTLSTSEFKNALSRFVKVLSSGQCELFYRSTIASQGNIKIEDFLSRLSGGFALMNARPVSEITSFAQQQLDRVIEEILRLAGDLGTRPSTPVIMRKFFERADTDGNGYLEPDELKTALRRLSCCNGLTEVQMSELVRFADLDGNGRINYLELLCMFSQRGDIDVSGASREDATREDSLSLGPSNLFEDLLEAVYRVLHFEYAPQLRVQLRKTLPHGCTRCTTSAFEHVCRALNRSLGRLNDQQIRCLIDSLDVDSPALDHASAEVDTSPSFDFEEFLGSIRIVDTLGGDGMQAE